MLQWSVVCTLQFDRPSLAAGPASASIYFSAPLVLLWSCSPQEHSTAVHTLLFLSTQKKSINEEELHWTDTEPVSSSPKASAPTIASPPPTAVEEGRQCLCNLVRVAHNFPLPSLRTRSYVSGRTDP